MLRVTPQAVRDGVERYRLEGRLAGDYVTELGRVLGASSTRPRQMALDLQGLTFVDADGADLLRTLAARNVAIHGCSGFVAHLLALPVGPRPAEGATWDETVETLTERHAPSASAAERGEAALLERMRAGDQAAREPFVRSAGARLLGTARRLLVSEAAARRVVQETLRAALRALRSRPHLLEPIELHRGLLARALLALRREVDEAGATAPAPLPRFARDGHHAAPVAEWAVPALSEPVARRVRDVLGRLPPLHRALFVLCEVEGLTAEQAATALRRPPSQVKAQLQRARQMAREGLSPLFSC